MARNAVWAAARFSSVRSVRKTSTAAEAAAGRVGSVVQLVNSVADFGEHKLRGEPALSVGELPARQVVCGCFGAVREGGGHPAGSELFFELLEGDEAPAVDESVGVDEEVGEKVAAVADEGVSPGAGYPDAVRGAIGDSSADHSVIVPQWVSGEPCGFGAAVRSTSAGMGPLGHGRREPCLARVDEASDR